MPKERRLAFINFVKQKSDTKVAATLSKSGTSDSLEDPVSSGKDVKKFYCDLLFDSPSSVHQTKYSSKVTKPKVKGVTRPVKKHAESITKQTLHSYFKAVEHGNLKDIVQYLDNGFDVDATDEHGWTALMCASCSGHLDVVKLLIERESNVEAVNKKGQTALDIASQAKQSKVVKYLQGGASQNRQPQEKDGTKWYRHDKFYCEVCKQEVQGCSEKSHHTSTVHLFNLKIRPKEQNYMLPETNAGFQMMLRSGWDKDKGLGSSGQGRKYPVKTVLKRDRLGLGIKVKSEAKVTHFAPKDKAAIEGHKPRRCMKNSTLSKRQQSKLQQKERAQEKAFRRDFY